MTIRIAIAWAALNKLTSIWKSNLPDDLKHSALDVNENGRQAPQTHKHPKKIADKTTDNT